MGLAERSYLDQEVETVEHQLGDPAGEMFGRGSRVCPSGGELPARSPAAGLAMFLLDGCGLPPSIADCG